MAGRLTESNARVEYGYLVVRMGGSSLIELVDSPARGDALVDRIADEAAPVLRRPEAPCRKECSCLPAARRRADFVVECSVDHGLQSTAYIGAETTDVDITVVIKVVGVLAVLMVPVSVPGPVEVAVVEISS